MKESKTRQATVEFASQLLKEFKEQRRFYETANIAFKDVSIAAIDYCIKITERSIKEIEERCKTEANVNPCVTCNTVEVRCKDCFNNTNKSRERFTQRTPNGASLILGEPRTQAEAAAILKEQFKKACNYLCELEDKLEGGQLVDTTPYILEIKNEIPFKYKVIKPTVHMRNVEMCDSRESAERCIVKLTEAAK